MSEFAYKEDMGCFLNVRYDRDASNKYEIFFIAGVEHGRKTPFPKPIPNKRTKNEVIGARLRPGGGCCDRYCDNKSCDCLAEAIDDNPNIEPQFKPGDVVQLKSGGTPMTVASVSANKQFVNVTWVDATGRP